MKVVKVELFPLSLLIKIQGVIVAVGLFSMVWGWICLGFFCSAGTTSLPAVSSKLKAVVPLFTQAC